MTGRRKQLTFCILLLVVFLYSIAQAEPTNGPLKVCRDNPRYFADADGKAILLVGSHVWYNLVDIGPEDPPKPFDYNAYIEWMKRYGHNFMRMWTWEMVKWDTTPNGVHARKDVITFYAALHPWLRCGPGKALDGKPKFDLTKFDPAYFKRLRQRVDAARQKGIYVSIMLFEGWAMQRIEDGWKLHPFNPQNNVNGVDGDANGDGKGLEVYELAVNAVTDIQKAYIRKVIGTVNDLDNVLYEISNENHPQSTQWQYAMIRYIHEYEKGKPAQHPVGMTFQYKGGANRTLFDSPAEWVSPNPEGGYRDNPPANDGKKVILTDTDHLWGIGGNQAWVWKSFTRGLNPIFMDPYDGVVLGKKFDPQFEPIRKSMGYALNFARRMDLNKCKPAADDYCLSNPGRQYLIYQPTAGEPVKLKLAPGEYSFEWFDPGSDKTITTGKIRGQENKETTITNPVKADAVLYIHLDKEVALAADSDMKAPDFTLSTFDGKSVKLSDYRGKTVVLEWMNTECPFSMYHYKTKSTMVDLAAKYKDKAVVWLTINSTSHTTPQANLSLAKQHKIQSPILDDRSGKVGRAYGAKTTPHIFIINVRGNIVYDGAIDNAPMGKVESGNEYINYVDKALSEIISGKTVGISKTKSYGCSVKYARR